MPKAPQFSERLIEPFRHSIYFAYSALIRVPKPGWSWVMPGEEKTLLFRKRSLLFSIGSGRFIYG